MNLSEFTHIRNPSNFEPIYPETKPDREIRKMEKKTGIRRTRVDVLSFMEQYNQKPLPICMRCDKTCIQRQVVGLISFRCFIKEER